MAHLAEESAKGHRGGLAVCLTAGMPASSLCGFLAPSVRRSNARFRLLALGLTAAVCAAGCTKIRARVELKKGNAFYEEESYEAAMQQFQRGLELDPAATFAWRSVGLSALALFRPGDPDPKNLEYAETAIDAFERYLKSHPRDDKVREYLLSTLMSAERFDDALAMLEAEARTAPNDPEIQRGIITVLTRAGRLDDALARATRATSKDPDSLYTIGVTAWDKAYNDPMLGFERRGKVVETGLAALEQANRVRPNHADTMVYLGLLLREKIKLTADPIEQQELLAQAEQWRERALAAREAEEKAAAQAGEGRES